MYCHLIFNLRRYVLLWLKIVCSANSCWLFTVSCQIPLLDNFDSPGTTVIIKVITEIKIKLK